MGDWRNCKPSPHQWRGKEIKMEFTEKMYFDDIKKSLGCIDRDIERILDRSDIEKRIQVNHHIEYGKHGGIDDEFVQEWPFLYNGEYLWIKEKLRKETEKRRGENEVFFRKKIEEWNARPAVWRVLLNRSGKEKGLIVICGLSCKEPPAIPSRFLPKRKGKKFQWRYVRTDNVSSWQRDFSHSKNFSYFQGEWRATHQTWILKKVVDYDLGKI